VLAFSSVDLQQATSEPACRGAGRWPHVDRDLFDRPDIRVFQDPADFLTLDSVEPT